MEKFIKEFSIDVTKMDDVIEKIENEMEKGLKGETSSLLMIPTFTDIPKGNENGIYLAIGY
jgi:hexokinase